MHSITEQHQDASVLLEFSGAKCASTEQTVTLSFLKNSVLHFHRGTTTPTFKSSYTKGVHINLVCVYYDTMC